MFRPHLLTALIQRNPTVSTVEPVVAGRSRHAVRSFGIGPCWPLDRNAKGGGNTPARR
jgi:hypothetical protein